MVSVYHSVDFYFKFPDLRRPLTATAAVTLLSAAINFVHRWVSLRKQEAVDRRNASWWATVSTFSFRVELRKLKWKIQRNDLHILYLHIFYPDQIYFCEIMMVLSFLTLLRPLYVFLTSILIKFTTCDIKTEQLLNCEDPGQKTRRHLKLFSAAPTASWWLWCSLCKAHTSRLCEVLPQSHKGLLCVSLQWNIPFFFFFLVLPIKYFYYAEYVDFFWCHMKVHSLTCGSVRAAWLALRRETNQILSNVLLGM